MSQEKTTNERIRERLEVIAKEIKVLDNAYHCVSISTRTRDMLHSEIDHLIREAGHLEDLLFHVPRFIPEGLRS